MGEKLIRTFTRAGIEGDEMKVPFMKSWNVKAVAAILSVASDGKPI